MKQMKRVLQNMKTRVDGINENIYNMKTSDSGKKKYGLSEEVIKSL